MAIHCSLSVQALQWGICLVTCGETCHWEKFLDSALYSVCFSDSSWVRESHFISWSKIFVYCHHLLHIIKQGNINDEGVLWCISEHFFRPGSELPFWYKPLKARDRNWNVFMQKYNLVYRYSLWKLWRCKITKYMDVVSC